MALRSNQSLLSDDKVKTAYNYPCIVLTIAKQKAKYFGNFGVFPRYGLCGRFV